MKPAFQALLRPLAKNLAHAGVTPNQVTCVACFFSLTLGLLMWLNPHDKLVFAIVPVFMVVRMGMNAIDGLLAKEHNMKTKLGAILNEITDVISDSALFLPFLKSLPVIPISLIIFILLSMLSEMAGVLAISIGSNRRYDGPMGKSDRAFVFGVLAIVIALGVNLNGHLVNFVFIVLNFLVGWTILNRAKKALQESPICLFFREKFISLNGKDQYPHRKLSA